MTPLRFRAWHNKSICDVSALQFFDDDGLCEVTLRTDAGVVCLSSDEELRSVKIMQSTALRDRDGIEIYEGDVLDCLDNILHPDGQHRVIGLVVWDDEMAMFNLRYTDPKDEETFPFEEKILSFESDYLVLGNMYERPNLLSFPQP